LPSITPGAKNEKNFAVISPNASWMQMEIAMANSGSTNSISLLRRRQLGLDASVLLPRGRRSMVVLHTGPLRGNGQIGLEDWVRYAMDHIAGKVRTMSDALDFQHLETRSPDEFAKYCEVALSNPHSEEYRSLYCLLWTDRNRFSKSSWAGCAGHRVVSVPGRSDHPPDSGKTPSVALGKGVLLDDASVKSTESVTGCT